MSEEFEPEPEPDYSREDKKLNFPAPDDNTTAFEAYHFGNKRDIIKEINATMIVFLRINLLLVQNKSKLSVSTSLS